MFDTVFSCQWFAALPSISRLFLLRGGIRFRYQTGSLPREVSLLNDKLSCSSSIPHAIIPDWWFAAKKSLTMFDCVEQALCSMSPLYSINSYYFISGQNFGSHDPKKTCFHQSLSVGLVNFVALRLSVYPQYKRRFDISPKSTDSVACEDTLLICCGHQQS